MKKILLFIMLFIVLVFPSAFTFAEEGMDKEGDGGVSDISDDDKYIKEKTTDENSSSLSDNSDNNGVNLAKNAKSAIIIEASTGKVIYEKNSNEKLAMASMTKMMTLLLIMENIENGNLKLDEMITTSANAASMGGSQIFLQVGEQMSVDDLLKGICIASGNDVVVTKKQSQVIGEEITI